MSQFQEAINILTAATFTKALMDFFVIMFVYPDILQSHTLSSLEDDNFCWYI